MVYFTTQLTTAVSTNPQSGTACNLNWLGGKPTTVLVFSTNATSSGPFTIQYTLDDIMKTASSVVFWSNLSSAYNDTGVTNSTASVFSTSSISAEGLIVSFLSPMAAVRLNSSTGVGSGPITMKVIQGEGW